VSGDIACLGEGEGEVWFTSDLHFGHARIVDYCDRPFRNRDGSPDPVAMAEWIAERFRERVQEDDTLIILGDVAMGTIAETLPLVAQLPGRKVLVPGNHDRCWSGHGERGASWLERYRAAGFAEIVDPGTDVVRIDLGGHPVALHHFPWQGSDHEDDRYETLRPQDDGGWLVHGHVHRRWRQRGRMINVGVDAWGGVPVPASALLSLIEAGPAERAVLDWTAEAVSDHLIGHSVPAPEPPSASGHEIRA
jgi:calcineurin-like phosphoesterase family protein